MKSDHDPVCSEVPNQNCREGKAILALLMACEEFEAKKLLPTGKMRLENYWVELDEDQQHYLVYFRVKRLHSERQAYGGHFTLGSDIQYKVTKETLSLLPPILSR